MDKKQNWQKKHTYMKYIIESYWQKAAKKSQQKKQKKQNWENSMRNKYGFLWDDYLGKVVYYKGEYGVVVTKDYDRYK